ncbi:nuclear transport factor 2 family protein [Streptomyces sp. NPDC005907]|uniref:nuclear transport factor 2 family protein n=1 Tax=Streptomyces sp. NPDC005907 TaxID=3154571 RepID=UPI0033DE8F25
MTQRVELATVMDRLAVDELITDYAVAVDDGDWEAYRALFAPGGRADYRSAGGIEGDAARIAGWLARSMGLFSVRQHMIVNRRVRFERLEQDTGDTARVRADYVNPMRFAQRDAGSTAAVPSGRPDLVCGGRYDFGLLRTSDGWRLSEVVVHEKWRTLAAPSPEQPQRHADRAEQPGAPTDRAEPSGAPAEPKDRPAEGS